MALAKATCRSRRVLLRLAFFIGLGLARANLKGAHHHHHVIAYATYFGCLHVIAMGSYPISQIRWGHGAPVSLLLGVTYKILPPNQSQSHFTTQAALSQPASWHPIQHVAHSLDQQSCSAPLFCFAVYVPCKDENRRVSAWLGANTTAPTTLYDHTPIWSAVGSTISRISASFDNSSRCVTGLTLDYGRAAHGMIYSAFLGLSADWQQQLYKSSILLDANEVVVRVDAKSSKT